jgi:uncharacterized protein (DUF488 family)
MATVFTAGHGARTTAELADLLRSAGAQRLIDVRRFPGSRRHPQFGREAMARALPHFGVAYEWRGDDLGGRRKSGPGSRHRALRVDAFRAYADYMETETFQRALDQLGRDAEAGPPLAVVCAETLWWQCHRRLIADALVVRGHTVFHLIDGKSRTEHELFPAARLDDRGLLVYDMGVTGELAPPASDGVSGSDPAPRR